MRGGRRRSRRRDDGVAAARRDGHARAAARHRHAGDRVRPLRRALERRARPRDAAAHGRLHADRDRAIRRRAARGRDPSCGLARAARRDRRRRRSRSRRPRSRRGDRPEHRPVLLRGRARRSRRRSAKPSATTSCATGSSISGRQRSARYVPPACEHVERFDLCTSCDARALLLPPARPRHAPAGRESLPTSSDELRERYGALQGRKSAPASPSSSRRSTCRSTSSRRSSTPASSVVGENRAQDLEAKHARYGDAFRWHFIGHLQSRKAKIVNATLRAVPLARLGVGRERSSRSRRSSRSISAASRRSRASRRRSSTRSSSYYGDVRGLMTMPPFAEIRRRRGRTSAACVSSREEHGLAELSMGTSQDYRVAVEEGATYVRVGSSIFGNRHRSNIPLDGLRRRLEQDPRLLRHRRGGGAGTRTATSPTRSCSGLTPSARTSAASRRGAAAATSSTTGPTPRRAAVADGPHERPAGPRRRAAPAARGRERPERSGGSVKVPPRPAAQLQRRAADRRPLQGGRAGDPQPPGLRPGAREAPHRLRAAASPTRSTAACSASPTRSSC